MRIALAIPSDDTVRTDTALSLLTHDWSGHDVTILNVRVGLAHMARYTLAKKAIEAGCEAIFWVDSDMRFPPDALRRLLAHNVQIVGTVYQMRREPYKLIGTPLEGDEVPTNVTGLYPMLRIPFGLVLVRTEVFVDLPLPWFTSEFVRDLDDFVPEDYSFCSLARGGGYEIFADLDLSHEVEHLGQHGYTWAAR